MKYTPYSNSKFDLFEKCKKAFWYKYDQKIKVEQDQYFFEKGSYFHHILQYFPKSAQDFKFKYSSKADIQKYREQLTPILKDHEIRKFLFSDLSEREIFISLNKNFKAFMNRDHFDYSKYMIGQIDWLGRLNPNEVIMIDWKSGKYYPDKSEDQLKLYAMWYFLYQKDINTIDCYYYYIEQNKKDLYKYHRNNLDSLISYFKNKINKIESETQFEKKITRTCEYCDFFNICNPFTLDNFKEK